MDASLGGDAHAHAGPGGRSVMRAQAARTSTGCWVRWTVKEEVSLVRLQVQAKANAASTIDATGPSLPCSCRPHDDDFGHLPDG
jgi:hypothetical protein